MKRLLPMVVILIMLIFMGCSKPAENKISQADQPKDKELTLTEVMTKTIETMEKQKGISYKADNEQKVKMMGMTLSDTYSIDVNMMNQPEKMYMKGTVKTFEDPRNTPVEAYAVDDVLYENKGGTWKKGNSSSELLATEIKNPVNLLNEFDDLFKLAGLAKGSEGLVMKKENGTYMITLDSTKIQGSEVFFDAVKKEMQTELSGDSKEFNVDFTKTEIEQFRFVLHIDEQTFDLKKMEQEIKMSFLVDGDPLVYEEISDISFQGTFDGSIEVPEEVKKKAISL